MPVEIRALLPEDDRAAFRCGVEPLDRYLHQYAGQAQFRNHTGVTYVAVDGARLLGYATVTGAQLDADALPGRRSRPPYPVPVVRLARLATDVSARRLGVGKALLRFAIELAEHQRSAVGCVGIAVDAKPDAIAWYERYGFRPIDVLEGALPAHLRTRALFLPLASVPRARRDADPRTD